MPPPVVKVIDAGLYCAAGNFYVDPWRPVDTAVITHAHSDHARTGSALYHATEASAPILRQRLGKDINLVTHAYGEPFTLGNAVLSFHSAGHVLGSAQVRIEADGEVWVVSGDYKRTSDPTCTPFDVVPCDTLITEATFALPIYRWDDTTTIAEDIYTWWQQNRAQGKTSVIGCYALGKAQRLLGELGRLSQETIYLHGALTPLVQIYRDAGIHLPPTLPVSETGRKETLAGELVLCPPSALGSTWMRRFKEPQTAFASGWMRVRANRRRRVVDRGFVLSDHTDWPGLIQTVRETGAKKVLVTHGHGDTLIRYLHSQGIDAAPLSTVGYGQDEEGD